MKALFALAAMALVLAGCATHSPQTRRSADPADYQVEKNTDQDLRNEEIRQRDRSRDFENDWDQEHFRDRGNNGHEDQGSLMPWPGSGFSGGANYPGAYRWGG